MDILTYEYIGEHTPPIPPPGRDVSVIHQKMAGGAAPPSKCQKIVKQLKGNPKGGRSPPL